MKVTSHRRKVHLTYREWHTLRVLMNSPGRVVRALRACSGELEGKETAPEEDATRTYISRLRRKLEPDPRYILLERGLVYRLVEAD